MKQVLLVTTVLVLTSVACSGQTPKAPIKELKTPDEKLSYAIGLEIGTSLKNLPTEIDFAVFVQAVEDGLKGEKPLLTQQQALEIKQALSHAFPVELEVERIPGDHGQHEHNTDPEQE